MVQLRDGSDGEKTPMPMLDHFRTPILPRSWESFHASWAVSIRNSLNRVLPVRFVAEAQVHLGTRVEADVAEFDTEPLHNGDEHPTFEESNGSGGVATAVATIAPPTLSIAMRTGIIDRFAVEIRDRDRDFRLAGVVELVSPGNKDRADAREMFVGKAAGYLLTAVGLVIADVVTTRHFNLHNELLSLEEVSDEQLLPGSPATYAAAYAPTPKDGEIRLDIWAHELVLGQALPVLPLKVLGFGFVNVDLGATYREACEWSRLP